MAFGFPNPFGGSSSSDKDNKSKSDSSTSSFIPDQTPANISNMNPLSPSSQGSSSEVKSRIQSAVSQQTNLANAKTLINKINESCFQHCVTNPGTSLSGKEQTCLNLCMEKYIDGWNTVSRSYIARLQKEGAQQAAASAVPGNGGLF